MKYFCFNATIVSVTLALPMPVIASPTVNGNIISWTEEGWHQVQNQVTFESICEGGSECRVPSGVYIVINHGTGERFKDISVFSQDTVAASSIPAPIPATQQTVSYGFGDDGDYQSGVSVDGERYVNNGNGTFSDRLTGLVWLSNRDCFVQRNWSDALDYANTLFAGSDACPELSDDSVPGNWRLPNLRELYSLVDITFDTALLAPLRNNIASGVGSSIDFDDYWTSSSFRPQPEVFGWAIETNFGRTINKRKEELANVWVVRDPN